MLDWYVVSLRDTTYQSSNSRNLYSEILIDIKNLMMAIYGRNMLFCFYSEEYTSFIQGVSIPMSQTFPGYSPPPNKQKRSCQHESKNEQVPRYRLTFMCWYPFEYHIRCSKCWPFAATHPLRRRIMDSLARSSWPGRFLMASNVATIRSHNSSTLVTSVE